jgi:hypothetical protein
VAEDFQTVSEGKFYELRNDGVLRSSENAKSCKGRSPSEDSGSGHGRVGLVSLAS